MNTDSKLASHGPLPPIFLVTAMVIMVGLHFVLPLAQLFTSVWRLAPAAFFLGVGVVLNLWADSQLKRADTTVKPFEPSSALIENDVYAVSRHPMYLGMLFILTGIALALGSLTPWLIIPVFVWQISQRFISAEEHKLEATFGARYLAYKAKVRRWL